MSDPNKKDFDYYGHVLNYWNEHPFFYDKAGIFWQWVKEEFRWIMVDEIDLMNYLEKFYDWKGWTCKNKYPFIEAFKRIGREKQPAEPLPNWIQFKDKVYDINTQTIFSATPNYYFCNPLPYGIGESQETPNIDKLFRQWVEEKHLSTLYEILAYCCYRKYPIHMIFCLYGPGMNGKGQYQKILMKFIGKGNICSSELDGLLDSRFESFKLYKKLVCQVGETNFGTIDRTSLLKKLTGEDLISFEYKNKMPIDDINYAKIVINTNSLPSTDDTSDGFWRRWLIIPFLNNFEGKLVTNIMDSIPEEEFNNLSRKIINLLPIILQCGRFSSQGTIKDQKDQYILTSNPLPVFINEFCIEGNPEIHYVRYSELYKAYVGFLQDQKKRIVGKREFGKALEREAFEIRRTSKRINGDHFESDNWVEGVRLK